MLGNGFRNACVTVFSININVRVAITSVQNRDGTCLQRIILTLHDIQFFRSKIDICCQHQRRVAWKIAERVMGWRRRRRRRRIFGCFGCHSSRWPENLFVKMSVVISKGVCQCSQKRQERKDAKQSVHDPKNPSKIHHPSPRRKRTLARCKILVTSSMHAWAWESRIRSLWAHVSPVLHNNNVFTGADRHSGTPRHNSSTSYQSIRHAYIDKLHFFSSIILILWKKHGC